MSNYCIDCEHYRIGICGLRNIYPYPPDRINCDKFAPKFAPKSVKTVVLQDNKWRVIEEKKPTVFDHLTQSPEMLAEKLVVEYQHGVKDYAYYSTVTGGLYNTKEEAIAATVEKLKEVEK